MARIAFRLGHHAEVYSGLSELAVVPPMGGIIIARDEIDRGGIPDFLNMLDQAGIWLPLLAVAEDPSTARIVVAIKAGALDYLPLPLDPERFVRALTRVEAEAAEYAESRKRQIEARQRIAHLSNRERQVLDWLAEGSSNKAIARELEISPRTVEIHRANMMTKLGARHAAEAVRLRIEAQI